MNMAKQFINKVKWIVDEKTACWNIITGFDNGCGYKYITCYSEKTKGSKRIPAHRMSYIAFNGDIPKGKSIMHSCDNRSCVNPDHLSIGTRSENTQDMLEKGRGNTGKGLPIKRLSDDQIREIKESPLSSYQLAKQYPVSSVQIRRIKSGARCSSIK